MRIALSILLLCLSACGQITVTGITNTGMGVNNTGTPVIFSFTANPGTISSGNSSTLSWTTSGCVSASIDQGVGAVGCNSTKSVSPIVNTSYTLTATNASGNTTAQVTVTVTGSGTLLAQWNGSGALPTGYTVAGHAVCANGVTCNACQIVNNGATDPVTGETVASYNSEASVLACGITYVSGSNGGSTGPLLMIQMGPNTCDAAVTGVGNDCNPPTSPRHFFVTWVENESQAGINGILNSTGTSPQEKRFLGRYENSGQNQHEWFMRSFAKGDSNWHAAEDAGFDTITGTSVSNDTSAAIGSWGGTWRVQGMSLDHDPAASGGVGCGYPNAYSDVTKTSPAKYWDATTKAANVTAPTAGCLAGMGYNPTTSTLTIRIGHVVTQAVTVNMLVWLSDVRVCTGPTEIATAAACGVTIP